MKYASTMMIGLRETVVVVLPLEAVPLFDPENPPQPNTYGVSDEVEVGWVKDPDTLEFIPPPPPTLEQLEKQYTDAVQKRLDRFAQTRGYDNILSACTYVNSQVPQFKAEGQYCIDARDNTWSTCYQILAQVLAGELPLPTIDELFDMLPALEWPA